MLKSHFIIALTRLFHPHLSMHHHQNIQSRGSGEALYPGTPDIMQRYPVYQRVSGGMR